MGNSWKMKQWVPGQSPEESKVTNPELLTIKDLLPHLCHITNLVLSMLRTHRSGICRYQQGLVILILRVSWKPLQGAEQSDQAKPAGPDNEICLSSLYSLRKLQVELCVCHVFVNIKILIFTCCAFPLLLPLWDYWAKITSNCENCNTGYSKAEIHLKVSI